MFLQSESSDDYESGSERGSSSTSSVYDECSGDVLSDDEETEDEHSSSSSEFSSKKNNNAKQSQAKKRKRSEKKNDDDDDNDDTDQGEDDNEPLIDPDGEEEYCPLFSDPQERRKEMFGLLRTTIDTTSAAPVEKYQFERWLPQIIPKKADTDALAERYTQQKRSLVARNGVSFLKTVSQWKTCCSLKLYCLFQKKRMAKMVLRGRRNGP